MLIKTTRVKTPQEKKLLSYAKDCRNTYQERGSHSRYAIRSRKNNLRRSYRHQAKQILNAVQIDCLDLIDTEEIKINHLPKRDWQKSPDEPLGIVVKRKLQRRYDMGINTTIKKVKQTSVNYS